MIVSPDGRPLLGNLGVREQVSAHIKNAVRDLMLDAIGDQILHATILGAGRSHFRNAFAKDMGPFFLNHRGPCDTVADSLFRFFEVQWRAMYRDLTPTQYLDRVEIKNDTPTEQEIEDAWELEIASSERAMRQNYDGSARTRKGADIFRANRNKG